MKTMETVVRCLALASTVGSVAWAADVCNPLRLQGGAVCPSNPGLNQWEYGVDFTKSAPSDVLKYWTTSAGAKIPRDHNGAALQYLERLDAPQLTSAFYIWFGRVEVALQVAPGQGIITSVVLMSDTADEIDWEWSGNNFGLDHGHVQMNYFGKGITGDYDRMEAEDVDKPQGKTYTYTLDWRRDRLEWLIDGRVVRTLKAADADNDSHQFPQTPSRLHIGIWAGGDPGNEEGVIDWAGGLTDVDGGPYVAHVKRVSIVNYNPAKRYTYTPGPQLGSMNGIKTSNQTIDRENEHTNPALQSLQSNLPVSTNGQCGAKSNTICKGSNFGPCCSGHGSCGSTAEFCGSGCQSRFGDCLPPTLFSSEELQSALEASSTSTTPPTSTPTFSSSATASSDDTASATPSQPAVISTDAASGAATNGVPVVFRIIAAITTHIGPYSS